jgi:hypothetical protein
MAELQGKLNELRGKLSVLQEQYAQGLYSAGTSDTDATRTTLQNVEHRINTVGAGIYRLSNATNKKLQQLEMLAKTADGGTALLSGVIAQSGISHNDIDVMKADALAEQMDREVRDTTVSFLYNLVAIGLVGFMALRLRPPTQ